MIRAKFNMGQRVPVRAKFEIAEKETISARFRMSGATDDHNKLINRNLPNQHPISAITGLEEALKKDDGKAYIALSKIKPYLYNITYGNLEYAFVKDYFLTKKPVINAGACSTVRNGNIVGRNFDWQYDESAGFVIRTPRTAGRYATLGVSTGVPELTEQFMESGEYNAESFKLLPFYTTDAINEYGLTASILLVPLDKGQTKGTTPVIEKRDEICGLMLVRYIVDNFQTAQESVEYLRDYVSIYSPQGLADMGYESHFMVSDKTKSYVIEFVNNTLVVSDITSKSYMTNFYLNGVTFNSDGTVYTPADVPTHFPTSQGITGKGSGLERFNRIVNGYAGTNTISGMRYLMNSLKFTNAYKTATNPQWNTEFVGEWNVSGTTYNLTVDSPASAYEPVKNYIRPIFEDRTRDGKTWQTVHSAVYDLENKTLNLIVQEDGQELEFTFDYYTKEQVDKLLEKEATARESADTSLGLRIDNEATARENADTELDNKIDGINLNLTQRIDEVQQDVNEKYDTLVDDIDDLAELVDDNYNELNTRITNVDADLQQMIEDNVVALQQVDEQLQNQINTHSSDITGLTSRIGSAETAITNEIARATGAESDLGDDIDDINSKMMSGASTTNPLVTKEFVNSSVQTATANFRGNWETWADVPTDANLYPVDAGGVKTPSTNDYMVVKNASGFPKTPSLEGTWRFKYVGLWETDGKSGWHDEYQVNETPFTEAQLKAINSTATKEKIDSYESHIANTTIHVTQTDKNNWNAKQDAINDLTTIRNNASAGKSASDTIATYGNIVTHNTSEFATASQGTKADTAVQPEDLATVATTGSYNDLSDTPTIPTKTSDLTNDSDFQTANQVTSAISAHNTSDTAHSDIREMIEEIKMFKFPNAIIVGSPTINNGQVSGFSNSNYLIFPFLFDVGERAFELNFHFMTGNDVTTPQNPIGSSYCMASYISNGKFYVRVSGNGTSWNVLDLETSLSVQANSVYYIRIAFNRLNYTISASTDGETYNQIGYKVTTEKPIAGQLYIGVGNNMNNPFLGIINLNKWYLKLNNSIVWEGMDDAGLATRADISLSNLDAAGEQRFADKQDLITSISKLSSDLVDDSISANKFVTTAEKNDWNGKQDALDSAQISAVNSGINSTKVGQYDSHIANGTIHVTASDKVAWSQKQNALVSGENIKTINGSSVLGSGNISVATAEQGALADSAVQNLGDLGITSTATELNYTNGVTSNIQTQLNNKQATISDLATIRSGAALGSTALQSVPAEYVTETELEAYHDSSKQNVTDNALTTTAKTIVGAINEVNAKPAVASLSGLTDVTISNPIQGQNLTYDATLQKWKNTSGGTVTVSFANITGHPSENTNLQNALDAKQDALGTTQMNAVNSGITSAKVETYDSHISNTTIHVTAGDKSTWNAKQNALVSGTNIKTVGGNSILGSGNIPFPTVDQFYSSTSSNAQSGVAVSNAVATKQDTLVSGTNIKTINGIPVLGSGNITIQTSSTPSVDGSTISYNTNEELQTIAVKNKRDDSTLPLWQGTEQQWNQGIPTTWYYWQTSESAMWTQTTLPASASWKSVTYGDGKFVAIASVTNIGAISSDGINWTQTTMPLLLNWFSVTYGNNKFVAIAAGSNKAVYSTDGINWTQTTMPLDDRWYSVTFGDGKFVAVAYNSNVSAYSTDGINWTQTTFPVSSYWYSVTYGNGKFVAIAAFSNKAAYSEDGVNWTAATLPSSGSWQSVTYGNGKFVAVRASSNVSAYSTDGINWTQTTLPASASWYSVTFGDGKFVAVAYNSNVSAYSTDGINWTQTMFPANTNWQSITYGDGKFVAVAYNSNVSAYFTITFAKCFTDTPNPTTSSVVYSAPETQSPLTITSVTSGAITLSDNNTYYYNQSGNIFTYQSIGVAHPDWLCFINNVGVKIGNITIASY